MVDSTNVAALTGIATSVAALLYFGIRGEVSVDTVLAFTLISIPAGSIAYVVTGTYNWIRNIRNISRHNMSRPRSISFGSSLEEYFNNFPGYFRRQT